MHGWRMDGSPKGASPATDLMERYGCHKNYPKELYDKVIANPATGFASNWSGGRPPPATFGADVWDAVDGVIRDRRELKKPASGSVITASLKKSKKVAKVDPLGSVTRSCSSFSQQDQARLPMCGS